MKSASIGYIHTFPIPYCRTPLGQADHSHVNAKPSWQGLHHNRVSLIPYSTRFRQLQLPERLHHRVAHARVRVIEPRNEGGAVLRERRRLQLSGRLHRRLANVLVRVLEPRNEGGGAVQPQLQYEAVVIERAVNIVFYGASAFWQQPSPPAILPSPPTIIHAEATWPPRHERRARRLIKQHVVHVVLTIPIAPPACRLRPHVFIWVQPPETNVFFKFKLMKIQVEISC